MRASLQTQLVLIRVVELPLQGAASWVLLLADHVRLDPMLPVLLSLGRLARLWPWLLRCGAPHLVLPTRLRKGLAVIGASIISLLHVAIFLKVDIAGVRR